MNKTYIYLFGLLGFFATTSLEALTLDEARVKGLVCELRDGYVAPTSVGASQAEVKMLIEQINKTRQQEYQKIAAREGTHHSEVGKLAFPKILNQPNAKACQ